MKIIRFLGAIFSPFFIGLLVRRSILRTSSRRRKVEKSFSLRSAHTNNEFCIVQRHTTPCDTVRIDPNFGRTVSHDAKFMLCVNWHYRSKITCFMLKAKFHGLVMWPLPQERYITVLYVVSIDFEMHCLRGF
jgi:hypothetical protein